MASTNPTELEKQRAKTEKATTYSLIVLGIALFLAIGIFVFLPGKTSNSPAIASIDSSRSITYDTVIGLKKDSAYALKKTVTYVQSMPTNTKAAASNNPGMKEKLDTAYLYFVLVFGALLLLLVLPRLTKFSIGKEGVSGDLSDKEKDVLNKVSENENQAQSERTGRRAIVPPPVEGQENLIATLNDPQKGLWGGVSESKLRQVTASYQPISQDGWVKVTLLVQSKDPKNKPLKDYVLFHMHPSFRSINVKIYVIDGIASYTFNSWGAFTVGVETDLGENFLELDLSQDGNAPLPFKNR